MEEFEDKFIKPIVNASYPGTLAALDLAVFQLAPNPILVLKVTLALGALGFLTSALTIFTYTLYPTRKKLWTATALSFLTGLFCSILAVGLFFAPAP